MAAQKLYFCCEHSRWRKKKRPPTGKHSCRVVSLTVIRGLWSRLACPGLQRCHPPPPPTISRLARSRPCLLCILGSLGGVLPALRWGMQATRRPNEVVSLRRIVILQFRFMPPFKLQLCDLQLHSSTPAAQHDFISCVVSFDPQLVLCRQLKGAVSFFFSFSPCTDPTVWHVFRFLYSENVSRCLGLHNGTFNLWPRKPEWIPSCTSFPQGHSENIFQYPVLK